LLKESTTYDQKIPIDGISCYLVDDRTFLITSVKWLKVLGSAALGGERRRARHIINHTVKKSYNCDHPDQDLARLAAKIGLFEGVMGLMTAVDVRHTVVRTGIRKDLAAAVFCTAGTGNACAAGIPVALGENAAAPGTINIVVLIDGNLTGAAMVNAVITATEAKTRAIFQAGIRLPDGSMATGTTTDAIVIACTGRGKSLPYAGAATELGYLVGHTVYRAVEQGLKDYLSAVAAGRLAGCT
jgi:iron complex transport system ATP-binding protein